MTTNAGTVDRTPLRLSAALMLAGQVLYILVTFLHTGGDANNHPAIFAAYAASEIWTAVHVGQFACVAIMLAGLFALFFAIDLRTEKARLAGRLGVASTAVALALYGGVLAVDGVALKQAVNAWASAPDAEKVARFASAEAMRWLEWGMRSYENFTLGLALISFAAAILKSTLVPRPVAYLMGLSAMVYLLQGWLAGSEGFSPTHSFAIVLAEVLNLIWMTWLAVVAWRTQESAVGTLQIGKRK